MIIVNVDKLEHVLSKEVGENRAPDLIVALENAGALRTVRDSAVITADQAEQWARRSLTPGDVEWLKLAVLKSTVPDDIGAIAHSLTLPDATQREDDLSDSRKRYVLDCGYFPAMLGELYAVADDRETAILDEVAGRAGLIRFCSNCGHRNPHWFDSCAMAH